MQKIYVVTKSNNKYEEILDIINELQLNVSDVEKWQITHYSYDVAEIQTSNVNELIKKKALAAFKKLRRPVLVEQTALKIDAMGGNLPGLQSSYILSGGDLQSTKGKLEDIILFCKMKNEYGAIAETTVCLCDGKNFYFGAGKVQGRIVDKPVDLEKGYGWDSIFIQDGSTEPYSSDIAYKKLHSMRYKALKELLDSAGHIWNGLEDSADLQVEKEELARRIADKKVILFIGAGISAAEGMPIWSELIGDMSRIEHFDPEIFRSYGDSMMLAEYLMSCKKEEVQSYLKKQFKREQIKKEEAERLYEYIRQLHVPVIYTTNFDNLLELYFTQKGETYSVCSSIDTIQDHKEGTLRIMKFHGDISEEDSDEIVLAESQYYERMRFDSFMDIQLQADLQKYSVLFLGYSLSDINVKMLMYMARSRWKERKVQPPKSYIFTATPNIIQKKVFEENGIISITADDPDKYTGTCNFLEELVEQVHKLEQGTLNI